MYGKLNCALVWSWLSRESYLMDNKYEFLSVFLQIFRSCSISGHKLQSLYMEELKISTV